MLIKRCLFVIFVLGIFSNKSYGFFNKREKIEKNININLNVDSMKLYNDIGFEGRLDYNVFKTAFEGYKTIPKNKEILTIIDYSKPSTEERFFIIDMRKKKLLIVSHVSHGKNSGGNIATSFSNSNNSYKSSLGFFLTENTYSGSNGYSLVLNGLELGINDKAKERYIVIHGANYANPEVIQGSGRLGRSYGCPALPKKIANKAIDMIKNGSVIFAYAKGYDSLKKGVFVLKK